MMIEPDNLEPIEISVPSGGISQQPPHLRFPNQVEDAVNATFSVKDGFSTRTGTRFSRRISGLATPSGNYRLGAIDRDGQEQYLVIHGNPGGTVQIRVFEVGDVEATVNFDAAAQTYLNLNNPNPDQIRLVTVADSTLILNTTVPTALTTSPDYVLTRAWRDYGVLLSHTPADQTYHRTLNDDATHSAGYWYYDVQGATFPTFRFADLQDFGDGGWADMKAWQSDDANPAGLTIGFQRFAVSGGGFTWTEATRLLTKTGAFTGLVGQFGDQINITGGTNVTRDWYPIEEVIDENTIKLFNSPTGGTDQSDLTVDGIGREFEISADFRTRELRDPHDVAAEFQTAFRRAGAYDVVFSWENDGSGNGYFVLTGPWRGSGAKIHFPTPPTQSRDFTDQYTDPFYSIGITSISAHATTPVITTDRPHGLTSPGSIGKVVTIMDSNSNVSIDGRRTIASIPSDTTFTVEGTLNTTGGAGTTGRVLGPGCVRTNGTGDLADLGLPGRLDPLERWTPAPAPSQAKAIPDASTMPVMMVRSSEGSPSVFDIDPVEWSARLSGDQHSNPAPRLLSRGVRIRDVIFLLERLVFAGNEFLMFSQSGDLFNVFQETFTEVLDTDPIDLSLSSSQVTLIDYLVPFRRAASIFTLAGRQFDIAADDGLTPRAVPPLEQTTTLKTLPVRPQTMGTQLYFLATENDRVALYEYFYDDINVATTASNVSAHADELLPSSIRRIATHANSGQVIVLPTNGHTLYVYRSHYDEQRRRLQAAWTVYEFDEGYRIVDIAVLGDDCWMLVEHELQYVLEYFPLTRERPEASWPYAVHLDRRLTLTGVHAGGVTTWTLPGGLSDSTLDTIVRGPAFGADAGKTVPNVTNNGTTLTAPGDHSAGACVVGRSYGMAVTLSRPYFRDSQGRAILGDGVLIRDMVIAHRRSGPYTVRVEYTDGREEIANGYTPPSGSLVASEEFRPLVCGDASHFAVHIESNDPRPVTIAGIQYFAEHIPITR